MGSIFLQLVETSASPDAGAVQAQTDNLMRALDLLLEASLAAVSGIANRK